MKAYLFQTIMEFSISGWLGGAQPWFNTHNFEAIDLKNQVMVRVNSYRPNQCFNKSCTLHKNIYLVHQHFPMKYNYAVSMRKVIIQ